MFFPELIGLELDALMSRFCSDNLDDHLLPERDFWFQEIAMSIAVHGDDGLSFLISRIPNADPDRLRAIVLSFSFLPKVIASRHLAELTAMLQGFLSHKDPIIIMEAIDTTKALGIKCLQHDVEALLNHKSPFVVGGVLRYLTSLFPERAKPILLESLKSNQPIVRSVAVDQIDDLDFKDALPEIRRLLMDDDKHVRDAAQFAISNLTEY